MFDTSITDFNLEINGGPSCQLRLLAIGGGGHGDANGGGSGFIEYHNLEISKTHSPYTVTISIDIMTSSVITINGTNGFSSLVINALPGQNATETKGGDGYSGGIKLHTFSRQLLTRNFSHFLYYTLMVFGG